MSLLDAYIDQLLSCALPEGGFSQKPGSKLCPDASAWAILGMAACGRHSEVIRATGRRMISLQFPDGRLPIAEGVESAHWPTSISVLAWKKCSGFKREIEKSAQFLIENSGLHFEPESDSTGGHNTALLGWPWNQGAHSWIEPTAMAILALRAVGLGGHARVREAVAMLLDRQLPSGGWNYGNKVVYHQELRPMPANTGQALCALGGLVACADVQKSIDYAARQFGQIRTPFSFCWCAFGLAAWSDADLDVPAHAARIYSLQDRYGAYATPITAMLILADRLNGNFLRFALD